MTFIPGLLGATGIATNSLTPAKLSQASGHTILGNASGSTANLATMTGTQTTALLDALVGDSGSGGTKGLVPAPASGDAAAGAFLAANGTWTVPGGGSFNFTSYTPDITFGFPGTNTGMSYTGQVGRYLIIGDLTVVVFAIDLFAKGSSTGDAKITLPSSSSGTFGRSGGGLITHYSGMDAAMPYVWLFIDAGLSKAQITSAGAGGTNTITNTSFTNSSSLRGFLFYPTA